MNKPQIFQEIENKLTKDDYASSLPVYHPAKGRRKRSVKEPEVLYKNDMVNSSPVSPDGSTGIMNSGNTRSQDPVPDVPPEIDDPDEKEIDPGRDLPDPGTGYPDEDEIPGEKREPEIEDPDEREFG